MTTINEVTQKRDYLEEFNSVVALYSVLKTNSMSLRVKQAVYRQDEVAAEPIDFIIDVEVKVKRAVGQRFYDIFLRAVYNEDALASMEEWRRSNCRWTRIGCASGRRSSTPRATPATGRMPLGAVAVQPRTASTPLWMKPALPAEPSASSTSKEFASPARELLSPIPAASWSACAAIKKKARRIS